MRQFQLFAHLSADIMLELAAEARVLEYRAGEYLWRQGEQNHRVLFIEQGLAIASRQVREGVSRTYGLFGPG
jgi:CRP-like cAMP-binding protein